MVVEETWHGRRIAPVIPAGSRAVTFPEIIVLVQHFPIKAKVLFLPEESGASIETFNRACLVAFAIQIPCNIVSSQWERGCRNEHSIQQAPSSPRVSL